MDHLAQEKTHFLSVARFHRSFISMLKKVNTKQWIDCLRNKRRVEWKEVRSADKDFFLTAIVSIPSIVHG